MARSGFFVLCLVSAVKATKDTEVVHDSGVIRIRAGEWLVYGDGYGPTVMLQEEIDKLRPAYQEGPDAENLRLALEKGHL